MRAAALHADPHALCGALLPGVQRVKGRFVRRCDLKAMSDPGRRPNGDLRAVPEACSPPPSPRLNA
jgi:hypothetical protein